MIEIDGITKIYGETPVVDNVTLTVDPGTICVVVGTSGSGKTTLMRMINRLVEPTSGTIRIDGEDTRNVPAYELRRRIGYAIQGHGLFPHRSVGQNIATVPKLLGWDKPRIANRVDELMDLFQLDPAQFRDRLPNELSGGQQQRVGVARALAAEPNILLMDEPYGALDPVIRAKAQEDLLAIQRRFKTTIVLVTHDMEEAIHLGSKIAVMDKGKLLQYDVPQQIIARPATPFVAELIGTSERPFRLLSLGRVADHIEPGEATGTPLDAGVSLRDAYAELLWSGRPALPVTRDGAVVGQVTLAQLSRLAARPQ
ncbi:amino acid ABC transporter ATP-binding protein [Devosia limi DSM 17137]|uniref:Amino acid ABC transporter ATP-binding protein n=1 Tax=Devosia limi DSM 17137 TaxID=1121477 RepID=A0A0F5LY48_9HYPH|nr:ABC transporter ATP-binding protein [Devosia limi]KKB86552.1 amino acid ABC transporter ATP-binding protein [Devosia limi DSM 17137]SHE41305.1 osmoprotectant transport system ATP-binding protein [Devosia limi DSM 17137]